MKIIDFHTHFYPEKVVGKALAFVRSVLTPATDGTRQGLLSSMRKAGIELSLGLPLVASPKNTVSINRFAAAESYGPIRCLGSVHPEDPDPAATVRWIAGMGLPGLKLHPEYQQFRFPEERLLPLWEACQEHGLWILTHAGCDVRYTPPFHSSPGELAAFHRRFPELVLVVAHFGGMEMWEEAERELVGSGVYLDLAFIGPEQLPPERLTRLIRKHGADRVLFGSDSPWRGQREAVDYIRSLPLTAAEQACIFYENAAKLLNLKGGS